MEDSNAAPRQQVAHPTCVDKNEWMKLVLADESLTPATKNVACRIALHHNSTTGRCDPGAETLSKGVGLTERAVQKAIAALKTAGFIDWTTPKGGRNVYTLKRINVWQSRGAPEERLIPPNARSGVGTNAGSGGEAAPTNAGSGVGTNAGSGEVRTSVQGYPRTVVRTKTGSSNPGSKTGSSNPGSEGAAAVPEAQPVDTYAFEDGVIRLSQRDYEAWKRAFPNLNLDRELTGMSKWAADLKRDGKSWSDILKITLAKKDRETEKQRLQMKADAEARAKVSDRREYRSGIPAI